MPPEMLMRPPSPALPGHNAQPTQPGLPGRRCPAQTWCHSENTVSLHSGPPTAGRLIGPMPGPTDSRNQAGI
jgi:hypothetical protein